MPANTRADQPVENNLINTLQCFPAGAHFPLSLKKSEGSYLHLAGGRKLLDCDCNGGVFSLGHRHPAVITALENALGRYDMGNHHLISEPKGLLGKRLAELLPAGLTRTVFNVTRSEAVEAAVKLARGATGKPGVIGSTGAFHGGSGFSLAVSDPRFSQAVSLSIPGFFHAPFNDLQNLKTILSQNHGGIAAVMLEPVAVEAGALLPDPGYLKNVRDLCLEAGVLLIIDESVTGLGRTGELFAVNHDGVTPDILIAGNALGGGLYPIHATCHTEALDRFYVKNPFIHISTFGGSELGCFAALAALDELSGASLLENINKQSNVISGMLESHKLKYQDSIAAVRRRGLLFAIEFTSEALAETMISLLLRHGVFCRCAALDAHAVLLLPALNIQDSETRELIDSLDAAFTGLAASSGGSA